MCASWDQGPAEVCASRVSHQQGSTNWQDVLSALATVVIQVAIEVWLLHAEAPGV